MLGHFAARKARWSFGLRPRVIFFYHSSAGQPHPGVEAEGQKWRLMGVMALNSSLYNIKKKKTDHWKSELYYLSGISFRKREWLHNNRVKFVWDHSIFKPIGWSHLAFPANKSKVTRIQKWIDFHIQHVREKSTENPNLYQPNKM